jgi:hypothetical protein
MARRTIGGVIFWGWNADRPWSRKNDQCQKKSSGNEKTSPRVGQMRRSPELNGLLAAIYTASLSFLSACFRLFNPYVASSLSAA